MINWILDGLNGKAINDKFCSQCSLVLDHEALEHVQVHEKFSPELIEALVKSGVGSKLLSVLK